MNRLAVSGSALVLCLCIVGCGSNAREGVVATSIAKLEDAASKLSLIKEKVNEAVKTAEKDNVPVDFSEALAKVSELKVVGRELQAEKRAADDIKEPSTAEEQKRLKERFQTKLNDVIVRLNTEKKELNEALTAAEKSYKEAVEDLKVKIREAEGEFEVLTRLR